MNIPTDPSAAIHAFNSYAVIYQGRYMDVGLYTDALDVLCANLVKGGEVLELACGPGNITKYLLAHRPDLGILATDLAPVMLELARVNAPDARFEIMDMRGMRSLGRVFDAIVCGFGLPYLTPEETRTLIRDAADVLRPKGVLYLSTMEDDPSRSGPQKPTAGEGEAIHVQYHRAEDLAATIEANGLSVIDLRRATSIGADGTAMTDVMIVARK